MGTIFSGGPKTGHKAKLYRNTGTIAVPVLYEVDEVGDVSLTDINLNLAELKRRANQWTKNLASLFAAFAVEFSAIFGLDKVAFEAMLDDFTGQRTKQWVVAMGDITTSGTYALKLPVLLENFPLNQPLEDVISQDVRLAVAFMVESGVEIDPVWVEIGGSAGSAA